VGLVKHQAIRTSIRFQPQVRAKLCTDHTLRSSSYLKQHDLLAALFAVWQLEREVIELTHCAYSRCYRSSSAVAISLGAITRETLRFKTKTVAPLDVGGLPEEAATSTLLLHIPSLSSMSAVVLELEEKRIELVKRRQVWQFATLARVPFFTRTVVHKPMCTTLYSSDESNARYQHQLTVYTLLQYRTNSNCHSYWRSATSTERLQQQSLVL
jgi:hypothetical protein